MIYFRHDQQDIQIHKGPEYSKMVICEKRTRIYLYITKITQFSSSTFAFNSIIYGDKF